MGKSITPANRIEIVDRSGYKWQTAFCHRATEDNLKLWIEHFNGSVSNGYNSHLGEGALVVSAKIVSQKGPRKGQVLFEVVL